MNCNRSITNMSDFLEDRKSEPDKYKFFVKSIYAEFSHHVMNILMAFYSVRKNVHCCYCGMIFWQRIYHVLSGECQFSLEKTLSLPHKEKEAEKEAGVSV